MNRKIPNDIIRDDLQILIKEGKLTCSILQNLTGVHKTWFKDFIEKSPVLEPLPEEITLYIEHLVTQLTLGMQVNTDSRLRSIIEMFPSVYNMNLSTLALCACVDEKVLFDFINGKILSFEQKYNLSTKILFLYYMFKIPNYKLYGDTPYLLNQNDIEV